MSDETSFDVQVVDEDGNPLSGVEVSAHFSYSLWPGTHSKEYTDDEGHANFRSDHPGRPLSVVLYVKGEEHGPYDLEDGAGFTITVS